MHRFLGILSVVSVLLAGGASARQVPSPSEFLGYELGTRFTPHHRIVEYFDLVASRSERVVVERYGTTYENRDLLLAFVSTDENLSKRDEIRRDHLRQARLEEGAVVGDETGLVWLSYNVHGNESVSSEVSMATLYELTREDGLGHSDWLEHTIVVIDPCVNPDGRERYVEWYNRSVGAFQDADPVAVEHDEPAPGGRGNHYLFDLNRDWSWFSQKETRERVAVYNRWLPHIHVDFHEQGVNDPYYFAPAVEPYHEAITAWQREFQEVIGAGNARVFDRNGWLFFTRESFDLLYPGYGDTYPTYNGAIGMTYEQGGSGRAGLAIETAEGDTLRLSDRLAHHLATSLSTIETAASHRERMVREFSAYFRDSEANPGGEYHAFVMHASSGQDRLDALAAHLDRLGIRYGTVTSRHAARGLDYRTGSIAATTVSPGDLVVSAHQPKGRFVRVLFEPNTALADSITYDITAWALPYAYGMEAHALSDRLDPDGSFEPRFRGDGDTTGQDIHGPVWPDRPTPISSATGRPVAYVSQWTSPQDARFLAAILRKGLSARVATEPFTAEGKTFARGTLVITRMGNDSDGSHFDETVLSSAREEGRFVVPVGSGLVDSGRDFGSSSVRFVKAPRILVIFGSGARSTSAGEVWHWFDERVGYPATRISGERLGSVDLTEWDVLVLPNGMYGDVLDEKGLSRVREWVSRGGRVVALEGAVSVFAGKEGFALKRTESDDETEPDEPLRRYADRRREGATTDVAGAVYSVQVDATHPLGFGLDRGHFVLRQTSSVWPYLEGDRAWNVGVLPGDTYRAGFVGHEAAAKMDSTLVFGVQEIGQGAVVYLPDGPLFRSFWYEGDLLFANAVFMPLR